MANFLIVLDPSGERRRSFIEKVKPQMAPVTGLKAGEASSAAFHALWATHPDAPVSSYAEDDGASFILGDAIPADGARRLTAEGLFGIWEHLPEQTPPPLDGYHVAARYSFMSGLTIGADILGTFPVYYYHSNDVLLAGSSPELFKAHPSFRFQFNPEGLAGILLCNGLFEGKTLMEGVKRLDPGNLLYCEPLEAPREIAQYRIPLSTRLFDAPFGTNVKILDDVFQKALDRHMPDQPFSMFFSGGLDSRMLGGYLKLKGRPPVSAISFGAPADIEMKCARSAIRALGFKQKTAEIDFDGYPSFAAMETKWRHLAGGFNCIFDWEWHRHTDHGAPYVTSGYVMDPILGGSHIHWAEDQTGGTMSFESFFRRSNAWGLAPEALKKLFRKNVFGDLVDETVRRMKTVYQSYSDLEFQRAFCFDLYHRQRFHTASVLWMHAFGAWPWVPSADTGILEAVAAMPPAALMRRRAQKALFTRRFPELARLPLDRNSYDFKPLQPQFEPFETIYYKALGKMHEFVLHPLKGEHRYYFRAFDFNGKGWRAVRRLAEPARAEVSRLFNRETLDALLPPPEKTFTAKNGILDFSGAKCLLGFMMWYSSIPPAPFPLA